MAKTHRALDLATRERLVEFGVGPIALAWGRILENKSEIAVFLSEVHRQDLVTQFLGATFEQAELPSTSPNAAFLATPAVAHFQHSLSDLREQLAIDQFHVAVSTLQWAVRQYLVGSDLVSAEYALLLYEAVNQILDAVMRETTQEWAYQATEVRRLKDELEGLYRISSHASAETDLHGVLRTVVLEIVDLLSADFGAVLLPKEFQDDWLDDEADSKHRDVHALEIQAMVANPDMQALLERMNFTIDEGGALARAFLTGQCVSSTAPIDDLNVTKRRRQTLEMLGFRHMLAAPLKMAGRVLGVACVANRDERRKFGTDAIHLLTTVCAQAAAAIRNKQLFFRNKALMMDLVFTLTQALDARDSYTRNHSANVAALAKRIAQEMGLSESECEDIYIAGLLHDIGKIGIADAVLHKPGALNRAERALMMQHPVKGAQILAPVRGLQHLLPCVRHHHERYDGNGYPDGLTGEVIPLGARILAMADAYDVMNNHRVYRRRRSPEEILREIKAMSGKQFDPTVVEVLLRLAEREGISGLTPKTGAVIPEAGQYYADLEPAPPAAGDGPLPDTPMSSAELVAMGGLLDHFARLYSIPVRLVDSEGRRVARGDTMPPEPPQEGERTVLVAIGGKPVGHLVAPSDLDTGMLEDLTQAIQEIVGRHETLESQVKQFQDLADLSKSLNSCLTPEEVLQASVEAAKRLVGADVATFWGAVDEKHLQFSACAGRSRIPWDLRISVGQDDGLEGYVAYRRIATAVVDFAVEDRFEVPEWIRQNGIVSSLAVPMQMGLRLVGVMCVLMYEVTTFSNEDVGILSAIANATAAAYENAILRQQFRSQEIIDPLSGLSNHRAFHERFAAEVKKAATTGRGLALVLFDVDHFTAYNHNHGFSAGDDLLRQVGALIRTISMGGEIASRFGGEEFAILIPAPDPETASRRGEELAERLRMMVAEASFPARHSMTARITISAGVASYPDPVGDAQSLIQAAQRALVEAKQSGRNKVVPARATA
ncbi:MAG: diguanylate cyclase [Candidatus Sericytochromatia bacterium]|nr:diguanylate cyclase [Candidatus Tanganyikabacteria bacterium]